MGTTAYGGTGSKGRAANWPIRAAGCRREQHTKGDMPTPPPPRDALEGGEVPPPPFRAPSLCPATVPLTASASFNGICNRQ